jgi:hypothetical protein
MKVIAFDRHTKAEPLAIELHVDQGLAEYQLIRQVEASSRIVPSAPANVDEPRPVSEIKYSDPLASEGRRSTARHHVTAR